MTKIINGNLIDFELHPLEEVECDGGFPGCSWKGFVPDLKPLDIKYIRPGEKVPADAIYHAAK